MIANNGTRNCGWDTETYLIAPPNDLIPKIVCASFDLDSSDQMVEIPSWVTSTGDGEALLTDILNMWQEAYSENVRIIIHNAAFDVCVILRYCSDIIQGERQGDANKARELSHLVWETLEKSLDNEWHNKTNKLLLGNERPILVSDTLLREQLRNLSTHGDIENAPSGYNIRYALSDLVKKYFKVDITGEKTTTDGSGRIFDSSGKDITGTEKAGSAWRLRYNELDGIPSQQWPASAYKYALDDSTWARLVWESQEAGRKAFGNGSLNSESLQVYSSIVLNLSTATGMWVDQQHIREYGDAVQKACEVYDETLKLNGILRDKGTINKALLEEEIGRVWNSLGRPPILTPSGKIASSKEVMEQLSELTPVLSVYAQRQSLQKIRTSYLPHFQGTRIFANYSYLKETGRTSSYGSSGNKKGRKPLYPAVNIQQMPRKPGMREACLPPPGYVRMSVDFKTLELCSVAQTTYNLLGKSVHRDKINSGYDLHSYLGTSIAQLRNPDLVDGIVGKDQRDRAYQVLMRKAKARIDDSDTSEQAEIARASKKAAKNIRNLAKPTGLGYPGGLGPATMVVYAKANYGVEISLEESEDLREIWRDTYTEMPEYFNLINRDIRFRDAHNKVKLREDNDGKPIFGYPNAYDTPGFERHRANCSYCETANGASMQSLSADGAKRALAWLGRACYGGLPEDNPYSILDGSLMAGFIHDEYLIDVVDDMLVTHKAKAVSRLVCDAMSVHMPDVSIGADPALMRRWTKAAEDEWIIVPGHREACWEFIEACRGVEFANMVDTMFGTKEDRVLIPWDDVHEVTKYEV